jgi:predicted PurR-regulated permease PerM
MNRRSPFFTGMTGAAGVVITLGVTELVLRAGSVLVLIGLALFVAVGLNPVISWLTRHRFPRWAAILTVMACALGLVGLFLTLTVPQLAAQTSGLAHQLPHYLQRLQSHNSELGKLNARYHIEPRLQKLATGQAGSLIGGVLGAGQLVLSGVSSVLVVSVLSIYFLAGLPQMKGVAARLIPRSHRARGIVLGDEISRKIGGYVFGKIVTAFIIGAGTTVWMLALGIPYAVLFGLFLGLIDMIPVIGSYIGLTAVTLIALTVSLPVAVATLGFSIVFKLAEDYLIVPRVMNRTVQVPGSVSLAAVLIGGALLGIVGALVAIPVAAVIRLLLEELAFPRLDRS